MAECGNNSWCSYHGYHQQDESASATTSPVLVKNSIGDTQKMNVETWHWIHCRLITSPHPRPQGLLIRRRRRLIPPVRRLPVIITALAGRSGSDPRSTQPSLGQGPPVQIHVVHFAHCVCSSLMKEKQLTVLLNDNTATFTTRRPFHMLVESLSHDCSDLQLPEQLQIRWFHHKWLGCLL